jgi:hypothetical protein
MATPAFQIILIFAGLHNFRFGQSQIQGQLLNRLYLNFWLYEFFPKNKKSISLTIFCSPSYFALFAGVPRICIIIYGTLMTTSAFCRLDFSRNALIIAAFLNSCSNTTKCVDGKNCFENVLMENQERLYQKLSSETNSALAC